jgi:GH15 family glucan-1,4-alpha-glucosidase
LLPIPSHHLLTQITTPPGLRLADKRQLPLLQRDKWFRARDQLYEEIIAKVYNEKLGFFAQSYEDLDVLDSAVLIMPLVFFCTPSDNRFISTLKQITKSRDRGGLTSNVQFCLFDDELSADKLNRTWCIVMT